VRFSGSQRHIEVVRGQALFSVAKNRRRPFVVDAGNRRIIALGTQFDVRLDNRSVQVTLLEGRVRVGEGLSGEPDLPGVELLPGKQLVARLPDPSHGSRAGAEIGNLVRDIDVSKVVAWREGRVFLNDVSLAEAIEEMNKHSVLQIRVEGTALADLHVNGLFKAGAQESFVAALEEYFPIAAQRRGDREIVLTAR
jgi:transmembrane sensor